MAEVVDAQRRQPGGDVRPATVDGAVDDFAARGGTLRGPNVPLSGSTGTRLQARKDQQRVFAAGRELDDNVDAHAQHRHDDVGRGVPDAKPHDLGGAPNRNANCRKSESLDTIT